MKQPSSARARPALFRWASLLGLALTAGCLGDVEVPPRAPTISGLVSPTPLPTQVVMGAKEAGTAIVLNEAVVVPHDDQTTWSYEVMLTAGDNSFLFFAQRESGLQSQDGAEAMIVLEPPCPGTPSLSPPPSQTQSRDVMLSGRKDPGLSIHLDGMEIVPADAELTWSYALQLPDLDGLNEFALTARDAKGQDSDPVRFSITLDRAAPTIAARYPAPNQQGLAINDQISIAFDDALMIGGVDPAPETLLIRTDAGAVVPGALVYHPLSRALVWVPQAGTLPSNATFTATLDPAFITDTAGNAASGEPDWTFTFTTTAAADMSLPDAPTVTAPPAQVQEAQVELSGTKGRLTSLWINGQQVAPVSESTDWQFALPLPVGTSSIAIASVGVNGVEVTLDPLQIERTEQRPAPPTISMDAATQSDRPDFSLNGGKPANTALLLYGNPVVCTDAREDWSLSTMLNPGINDLLLQTRDEAGVISDPVVHSVEFSQQYEGLVPEDFALNIRFNLRDLSQVSEIRSEFVTGANNFGIDAWVEGPIGLDETCSIQDGQRQNIKYVATIQHYIGTKAQHKVPFADEDYRGTDYLASMISANIFAFLGLNPESPRRDGSGKELEGLLSSVSESDLRDNIDCFGSPIVDVCSRATTNNGPTELVSWTPRRRNGQGLLEQGDYLLHIMINLDRDGSWLSANDFETCWGDPAFDEIGMHRIVQRISLGSSEYTLNIPQSAERSGADREGAGKLYFIDAEGVTITWGPNN